MTAFISHIQIANGLLCLLMAAQLFFLTSMRPIPKRILGFNCLLYAHQSFMLVAILSGISAQYPLISQLRVMVAFLLGPTLLSFVVCVKRPNTNLQLSDALHFIVGLLIFVLLKNVQFLRPLIDDAILASFVFYTALIMWKMRPSQNNLQHLGIYSASASTWLIGLMMMAIINIALEIAIGWELQQGTPLNQSISLLVASIAFFLINAFIMLAALSRSHLLEWLYLIGDQHFQTDAKDSIQEEDEEKKFINKALFDRWHQLVHQEKLFQLEFGITLAQAAKKLQVPARQLSQAVNQVYGNSFSVYMNDQRINSALEFLRNQPEITITQVMYESGFSSKSNFNKEFLRVTGLSPTAYKESLVKPD